MKLKPLTLSLALAMASTAAHASTQNNTFDIFSGTTKTATGTFTLDMTKDGIKVHSKVDYVADKLGQLDISYKVGADGIIDNSTIIDSGKKTMTYYTPSKANDQLSIAIMRNNQNLGERKIPMQAPDFVVAFSDDPSVWQTLVNVTATHPHSNTMYQLFVPGTSKEHPDRLEPYVLNSPTAAKGTLNGAEVTLKHYSLRFNAGLSDIYTDADGNLMEADITPLDFHTTRSNFMLNK
jgi:hypothetical protein